MLTIKQRQINLQFLNYYKENIDNIEGSQTKEAYRLFQKDYGLIVDGIYGSQTNAKLIEVIKEIQEKIGTAIDGIVGTNTISKLKEYQEKNGLAVDGICGINTITKLRNNSITWNEIKYFKKEEFTCKCGCGSNNMNLEVVKIADQVREHFGKPAIVNSGYRCESHNKYVGGVSGSRHLSGKAIDLYVQGVDGGTLLNYLKTLVQEGKLRYTYRISSNGSACHFE